MNKRPKYYGGPDNVYEVIKVIQAWQLGFELGNVVKYIRRSKEKHNDPLEDLRKARQYLDFEIARHEKPNVKVNIECDTEGLNELLDKYATPPHVPVGMCEDIDEEGAPKEMDENEIAKGIFETINEVFKKTYSEWIEKEIGKDLGVSNDYPMYEELYGKRVKMNDSFESVHIWSKELAVKNKGEWKPELVDKEAICDNAPKLEYSFDDGSTWNDYPAEKWIQNATGGFVKDSHSILNKKSN